MWPTGQTSNSNSNSNSNSLGGEDVPLLIAHAWLALVHRNSWLETHFVLVLAIIIEYTVFQLSLSYWFVFIETSRQYTENLMERCNSQDNLYVPQ